MTAGQLLSAVLLSLVLVTACSSPAPTPQPVSLSTGGTTDLRAGYADGVNAARPGGGAGGTGKAHEESRDSAQQQDQENVGRASAPASPSSSQPAPREATDGTSAGTLDESATQLPIVQGLGRMIIYNTDLTLVIANLDALPNQLGLIALGHGGYVAGVETKEENGIPTLVVRLKVAPAQYDAAMQEVRALAAEVRDEKAATRDVTEEHDDVAIQIASLEATHTQLLRLMESAGSVDDLLKVQQQAAQVKSQIDRLKGRLTAMERLSELATITTKAYLASAILPRDYTAARSALRRAEANRVSLEAQLARVRTPEEEASLRDKLGDAALEIMRLQGRLSDLERKATATGVTLPAGDASLGVTRLEESLPREYIETRVELRRARQQQTDVNQLLREGRASMDQYTAMVVRINQLEAQLRTVQERARQSGIALPSLTNDEEALLAGEPLPTLGQFQVPQLIRMAWEGSLWVLLSIASALVFFWWVAPVVALVIFLARRRRGPALNAPEPAAIVPEA